jgi:hypothetical protein
VPLPVLLLLPLMLLLQLPLLLGHCCKLNRFVVVWLALAANCLDVCEGAVWVYLQQVDCLLTDLQHKGTKQDHGLVNDVQGLVNDVKVPSKARWLVINSG